MSYETEVNVYVWIIRNVPTLLVIVFAVAFPVAVLLHVGN